MHDLPIASNIVELVAQAAAGRRVRRVTLRSNGCQACRRTPSPSVSRRVARGTDAEDANLEIREIDEVARCDAWRGSIRHAEPSDGLLLRFVELSTGERR